MKLADLVGQLRSEERVEMREVPRIPCTFDNIMQAYLESRNIYEHASNSWQRDLQGGYIREALGKIDDVEGQYWQLFYDQITAKKMRGREELFFDRFIDELCRHVSDKSVIHLKKDTYNFGTGISTGKTITITGNVVNLCTRMQSGTIHFNGNVQDAGRSMLGGNLKVQSKNTLMSCGSGLDGGRIDVVGKVIHVGHDAKQGTINCYGQVSGMIGANAESSVAIHVFGRPHPEIHNTCRARVYYREMRIK